MLSNQPCLARRLHLVAGWGAAFLPSRRVSAVSNDPNFAEFWFFHTVNYLIALEIYTMFGRVVLSLFVRGKSNNAIMKAFVFITDPVIRALSIITPRFLVVELVPLYAAFWLIVFRLAFGLVMLNLGLAPTVGAP